MKSKTCGGCEDFRHSNGRFGPDRGYCLELGRVVLEKGGCKIELDKKIKENIRKSKKIKENKRD